MSDQQRDPSLDDFLGEPTRDIDAWRRLWETDLSFPIRSHRGPLGRLVVLVKRLLRPLVKVPQNDLWERQRVFNLIVLEHLERSRRAEEALAEIDRLRWNAQELKDLSVFLTRFVRSGLDDLVGHNDALFSRVDQKLDRYRRESRRLWASLAGALEAADSEVEAGGGSEPPADVIDDPELDEWPSGEAGEGGGEVEERLSGYLELLGGVDGTVLDVGCGRGEVLELLARGGLDVRGVDSSAANVAECQDRGLQARRADPLSALRVEAQDSLGAVISSGGLERLEPAGVAALVRLAWRALAPGGVLLIETANPLSMVVAARDFWRDPRRRRPLHPEALEALVASAGFERIRRLDHRPFPDAERLPEISLEGLSGETRQLADRLNRLRDRLDDLLYGDRSYVLTAVKGEAPAF